MQQFSASDVLTSEIRLFASQKCRSRYTNPTLSQNSRWGPSCQWLFPSCHRSLAGDDITKPRSMSQDGILEMGVFGPLMWTVTSVIRGKRNVHRLSYLRNTWPQDYPPRSSCNVTAAADFSNLRGAILLWYGSFDTMIERAMVLVGLAIGYKSTRLGWLVKLGSNYL